MPDPREIDVFFNFGGLAIVTDFSVLDPWLCVTGFRQFCLFNILLFSYYHF
jgi:hypothetical protein